MMPYVTANLDTILAEHGTGKAAMRTSQKSVKQLLFESASRQNELHVRWRNAMGNVTFEPLQIRKVTTFQVRGASRPWHAARAQHSHSPPPQPPPFLLSPPLLSPPRF